MAAYLLESSQIGQRLFQNGKLVALKQSGYRWHFCRSSKCNPCVYEQRTRVPSQGEVRRILGEIQGIWTSVDAWDKAFYRRLIAG